MIVRLNMIFGPFLAVFRAFWWKIRGYKALVSVQQQEYRSSFCHICPEYHPDSGQCGVCGCLIEAKTWLAAEQCPKRFWLRVKRKKGTI